MFVVEFLRFLVTLANYKLFIKYAQNHNLFRFFIHCCLFDILLIKIIQLHIIFTTSYCPVVINEFYILVPVYLGF